MGGSEARRPAPWLARTMGLLLVAALAGPVEAAPARIHSDNPETLRRELDSLRVTYRDDHPDVIRARRALEKALEKRRKAAEAEAGEQGATGAEGGAAGAQPR